MSINYLHIVIYIFTFKFLYIFLLYLTPKCSIKVSSNRIFTVYIYFFTLTNFLSHVPFITLITSIIFSS